MQLSKVAFLFGVLVCLVRCAAPETCVRGSDCDDGQSCTKGACVPAGETSSDAPEIKADASATSIADAATTD